VKGREDSDEKDVRSEKKIQKVLVCMCVCVCVCVSVCVCICMCVLSVLIVYFL